MAHSSLCATRRVDPKPCDCGQAPRIPPKTLTLTTGDFLFTKDMVRVAEMSADFKDHAGEICRRYNLHEALVAAVDKALAAHNFNGRVGTDDEISAAVALRDVLRKARGIVL